MEKVKIKSVVNSGRKWNEKDIYIIELEDGRKGSSFDPTAKDWKGEIELEIKEGKEYQGAKQLIFNLPKSENQKSSGGFPKKDWSYEKRRASLEFSLKFHDGIGIELNSVLETADKFFNYLNK